MKAWLRTLVYALTTICPASIEAASLEGWRVSGTLVNQIQSSAVTEASSAVHYCMEVFEGGWRLSVEPVGQPSRPTQEYFSDGSNVVQVTRAVSDKLDVQPATVHALECTGVGRSADVVRLA